MNRPQLRIQYEKTAEKFFRKHESVRREYEEAVLEFYTGEHPEKIDVKIIKGKKGKYYRIRLRDWRVVYMTFEDTIIVIDTLFAGSRGDIYKKIGGLNSILF